MKISYRKYPSLQIYDKQRCKTFINTSDYLDILPYAVADKSENTMKTVQIVRESLAQEISDGVRADYRDKSIYYLSPAFMDAVMHAIPQINQWLADYEAMSDVHEDCVMILPSPQSNGSVLEFSTENDGHHRMTRSLNGVLTDFYIYDIVKRDDGRTGFRMSCYLTMEGEGDMELTSIRGLSVWYAYLLFKKYANVETYLIEAGQKQFMKVNFSSVDSKTPEHKAKNEAGINVIVLDSRWYTAICREEKFMVSGHFRLQPCKDEAGHWTRKLIYIAAYEKHGYHRRATVARALDHHPQ